MARLNILHFPDPRLRKPALPVATIDDEIRRLIDDLFETMYAAPGIGLAANQVNDSDALLALRVDGADLSLDHGYPARIIVPALPGVHNTKWVASIEFAR